MKSAPENKKSLPNITLPQLILTIASMVMFIVFLITLYLNFYSYIFFAVWVWIIASALIYFGSKSSKPQKALYIIMGIAAIIAGIVVLFI